MNTYYLAVDIGASSGRHILGWLDGDIMRTEEIYRFQNAPLKKENADGEISLFWDTERLFNEILNGLKRAGELGRAPVSIGIDTWGVDYVLLDEQGNMLYRGFQNHRSICSIHRLCFQQIRNGYAFRPF